MRLFAITPQGLVGITLSVIGLWGCIAMERTAQRRANRDLLASQIVLAQLRGQKPVPVIAPVQNPFRADHPAVS